MSKKLKFLDYFFLTRPILFIPGWATLLAGYSAGRGKHQIVSQVVSGTPIIQMFSWKTGLALLSFACAMGGCFILNQLQDVQTDKKNNKLFLLGGNHVPIRDGYIESFVLLCLALGTAFALNDLVGWVMLFFIVVTGYLYNFSPFLFKNKALFGALANIAMGWSAFAIGWFLCRPLHIDLILSVPLVLYNTALYCLTTIPDIAGDQQTGKVTIAVKYGAKVTLLFTLLLYGFALLTAWWYNYEFMLLVGCLAAPVFLRLLWKRDLGAVIVTTKTGLSIFALLLCLQYPLFFIMLFFLYFFTRFYYRHRFNFSYPNFRGC